MVIFFRFYGFKGVNMPRIRGIKHNFFSDEDIANLDPLCRLFYVGLWIQADREGRLEDRPKYLKAVIFPYDDCDVDSFLNILSQPKKHSPSGRSFIKRYEVGGKKVIEILSFKKHQYPNKKEAKSVLPPSGEIIEDNPCIKLPIDDLEHTQDESKLTIVSCPLGCKEKNKETSSFLGKILKDRTEAEYRKCYVCGTMFYDDGHAFNPKTKISYTIKDGKAKVKVEAGKGWE